MDAKKVLRNFRERAAALGFGAVGVARADAVPEAALRLRRWIADGCHGDMLWMAETEVRRGSPRGLWPDVNSIIALGTSYAPPVDPLRHAEASDTGVISVYALGDDYHDIVKARLKALARWLVAEAGGDLKVFVDTAPVMEKPLAAAAGIGWQGKHTNLVSRDHGSWLFLGAIYTTLVLPEDAPHADRCGRCDACQRACPTAAFPAPYRLDARRCISYLTIEHKGPIPHEFRRAVGNRIYGCDDCLAACPWNRFAQTATELNRYHREWPEFHHLGNLLGWTEATFRERFRGSPFQRAKRSGLLRNAAIVLGNRGDPRDLPSLAAATKDPDGIVAEHAAWAIEEIRSRAGESPSCPPPSPG